MCIGFRVGKFLVFLELKEVSVVGIYQWRGRVVQLSGRGGQELGFVGFEGYGKDVFCFILFLSIYVMEVFMGYN